MSAPLPILVVTTSGATTTWAIQAWFACLLAGLMIAATLGLLRRVSR
jgi:hypothetical protein